MTYEADPANLRRALLKRLTRRVGAEGAIAFPAVPALVDHFVATLNTTFSALGRVFSAGELAQLRQLLLAKLEEARQASPYSKVLVGYATDPLPKTSLTYRVAVDVVTMADEYDSWVESRTPPLFGSAPDAKVMHLAASLGDPTRVRVLDIGAGTGRNTLPLARAGFVTDAVELAPSLAQLLRTAVAEAQLPVGVYEGDAADPALALPRGAYQLVILAEVIASHFQELGAVRRLLERIADLLAPGGLLLFNAFLAHDGYEPDDIARQLSHVLWTCLFTRAELTEAFSGLPFERVSDESTYAFESAHLASAAWPPTGWFGEWSRGQDLFDLPAEKSPFELRWLVYRHT